MISTESQWLKRKDFRRMQKSIVQSGMACRQQLPSAGAGVLRKGRAVMESMGNALSAPRDGPALN